jgi:hypothetical protein
MYRRQQVLLCMSWRFELHMLRYLYPLPHSLKICSLDFDPHAVTCLLSIIEIAISHRAIVPRMHWGTNQLTKFADDIPTCNTDEFDTDLLTSRYMHGLSHRHQIMLCLQNSAHTAHVAPHCVLPEQKSIFDETSPLVGRCCRAMLCCAP